MQRPQKLKVFLSHKLKKLKSIQTEVTAAHRERVEKVAETSKAAVEVEKQKFKEQLEFLRKKNDTLVISKEGKTLALTLTQTLRQTLTLILLLLLFKG